MIDRVNYLKDLLSTGIKLDEFCFAQSAWLAALGLRKNSDLDIVLRPDVFYKYKPIIDKLKHIDLKINSKKFCSDDNALFNKYLVTIDGYQFSDLKFYVNLLRQRLKDNVKVEKTKHILALLEEYFKEYKDEYLITKECWEELRKSLVNLPPKDHVL